MQPKLKRLFREVVLSVATAATATFTLSSTVSAATLSKQLSFITSNQSVLDTGTDSRSVPILEKLELIGAQWKGEKSFGIFDVGGKASTEGKIGLQNNFSLKNGLVSASIPVSLTLTVPDQAVQPGETFTIQSSFSFENGARFDTIGPALSDDPFLNFNVGVKLEFNPGPDFGFSRDKAIPLPDVTLIKSIGNTRSTPPSSSSRLVSSEKSEFLKLPLLDIDKIATKILGLPSLEGKGEIDLWLFDVPYSYDLLDLKATAALSFIQNFALTGTLPGLLTLENGSQIPFNVGDNIPITVPNGVGKTLDINANINFSALFKNTTSLEANLGLDVTALKASLDGLSIGPLFKKNIPLFKPSKEVYNKEFPLVGFNSQEFNFSVPVAVPEPSCALAISLFGAFGAGSLLKRKQQQKALDKSLS